jgi:hypothetical protein
MKRAILFAAIAMAAAASVACGSSSPTTPTTPTTTTPTPANIAGSYDLTLAVSQTCAQNLPPAARMFKYIATITQTGTLNNLIIMTLSGDVAFGEVVISGVVSDKEFKITQFAYSEKTTGGGIALIATGSAAIAADGSMTGTLSGIFQTPAAATCNSTVHGIQLVKR